MPALWFYTVCSFIVNVYASFLGLSKKGLPVSSLLLTYVHFIIFKVCAFSFSFIDFFFLIQNILSAFFQLLEPFFFAFFHNWYLCWVLQNNIKTVLTCWSVYVCTHAKPNSYTSLVKNTKLNTEIVYLLMLKVICTAL